MKKGDIVLVPFPFTDLTGNKNRPALILVAGKFDTTVAFISTQLGWKEDLDILLLPNEQSGLKKESLIRLSKLATIDNELILGRLGSLEATTIDTINVNLKKILQLD